MTVQRLPWVTIAILGVNLAIFLLTWPQASRDYARMDDLFVEIDVYASEHPDEFDTVEAQALLARWEDLQSRHIFSRYGYVPAHPTWKGVLGSLFLHAGWMHLLGNMYLLWLCGCSIEDLWGRPLYAGIYVLGGVAATLAHGWFQSSSTAHLVGASGAIAALMGVFFIRCWNTRIRFFYWFFLAIVGTFTAPAWIMLLLWLGKELVSAVVFAGSPVAFWAHIGGFGFGAAAAYAMKLTRLEEKFIAPSIERKTNLVTKHPKLASALAHLDGGDPESAIDDLSLAIREDPEDPDLYQWMARCYMNLGKPGEAVPFLQRELNIHLRKRESEMVAQTYMELLAAAPDFELPSKQLPSIAGCLAGAGYPTEAGELLEKAMGDGSEPLLRLRAGIALAVLHHEQGRTQKGLALLEDLAPLAASHPEWQSSIAQKRQAILSSR